MGRLEYELKNLVDGYLFPQREAINIPKEDYLPGDILRVLLNRKFRA